MNKKFLSAILFGALMVTSTGTFVSCKDYDDDIENLQGQISANASAIAELKALIGDGNYVTSVTVSGQNLVVNTKNGSTTVALPECEDKVGSICTISEEGELLIDGKATGIKVAEQAEDAEFLPAVEIVDGEWAVLQEDGTYKSTGVAVSSVAVTGDKQNGYVLTVKDAEGNATVVELPTAASLITSINVAPTATQNDPKADYSVFNVSKATFVYNRNEKSGYGTWAGKKEVPSKNSVVYSPSYDLNVRVNPVDAPVEDVVFYLTNTKNHSLSEIELTASPTQMSWNGPIGIGSINGRSVTNNGLWTLSMPQYILNKDAAKAFEKDMFNNGAVDLEVQGTTIENSAAFAVNANDKARSEYSVAVSKDKAKELTAVTVKNFEGTYVQANLDRGAEWITVNVGTANKIEEISGEGGLMYDMFFAAASETVIETYGLEFDHLNRTFTVTKRPDVVTTATNFELKINTLDIWGNIKVATYKVKLSANVGGATVTYPAVEHNLAKLVDGNGNNDNFTAAISDMKTALADNWAHWANNVDLANTTVEVYKDASLAGWAKVADVTASSTNGLTYELKTAGHGTATSADDINYIKFNVKASDNETFTIDTQYYAKVSFYGKKTGTTSQLINYVVVPVTFVAPTVADQFALKSGYVVDNVINAYYYNYTASSENVRRSVQLSHYFDKVDAAATLTLDKKVQLATYAGWKALYANDLAVFVDENSSALSEGTEATIANFLRLKKNHAGTNDIVMTDGTNREWGYAKDLAITAYNEDYKGWLYKEDAQTVYNFTIKLMSPIFEGVIAPTSGSTINVTANAEEGFAITKSMITLADYNKNTYNVVPDVDGKKPTNAADNTIDAWKAEQIANVWVTKDANNTYIKKFDMRAQVDATDTVDEVPGAIMLYADPLPNTQATTMDVHVTDAWGYNKAQEVSVTIVKQ